MADLVSAVTTWKVVLHGVHHAHSSYATEESQALFPAPFVQPAKIVKIVVSDPVDSVALAQDTGDGRIDFPISLQNTDSED